MTNQRTRMGVRGLIVLGAAGIAAAAIVAALSRTGPTPPPGAAPSRPDGAGAPPGLAPAPVPARLDPCAALKRQVDGSPPDLRAAQGVLAALSPDCLPVVSDAWGQAIAVALCERPTDPDLTVPARWALAALVGGGANGAPLSERVTVCLLDRAAAAEGAELALLVEWLVGQTEALPRHFNVFAPSERGLALAAAVLRRRPPSDLAWWAKFWEHLQRSGLPLRRYLLHVMGRDFGYQAGLAFVTHCVAWEVFHGPVGPLAVGEAGAALQPFAPPSAPPAAELVPDSSRLRLAMLYVVPPLRGLPDEVPWFAAEEVQERLERLRREDALRSDPAAEMWAVAYAGNQWRLTGDAVALRDLERFAADDRPIEAYAASDRERLVAALRRAADASASSAPGGGVLAGAVRAAVAGALQRGTPKALSRLVTELGPWLSGDEALRDALVEALGARLDDLDPRSRARLSR